MKNFGISVLLIFNVYVIMQLLYGCSPCYDCFIILVTYILIVFYSLNLPTVHIDPANAVANFIFKYHMNIVNRSIYFYFILIAVTEVK